MEIHDPFSNRMTLEHTSNADPECTSDENGNSVEFRVIMAYAQRRRPNNDTEDGLKVVAPMGDLSSNGPSLAKTEKEEEKRKKKKKKRGKSLLKYFGCIKPLIKDEENTTPAAKEPDVEARCGFFIHGQCCDQASDTCDML